ncbi:hypothetical protein BXZ70DRAFT_452932 [Cristinia sonorae]|uniref:F-box domain-containing protein n=1 Tax=Cristinia sonorae TaxID=1940300 RepID=A0A8K0UI52_9AGAR|nr:hypothetical protein BXZ70DRAFT_452932 [Cristinia sonorae]
MDNLNVQLFRLRTSLMKADRIINVIHNAASTVHRLPVEILVYIFKIIQQEALRLGPFPEYNPDVIVDASTSVSRHWIGLLHVCHRWRHVLLSERSLWSTVILDKFVNSRRMLDLCIAYSGSLPLRIYRDSTDSDRGAWSALTPQIVSRTRELRYRFTGALEPITEPTPSLECLDIVNGDTTRLLPLGVLFQDQTPSLRRLALKNILSWAGNNFAHLTDLCIQGAPKLFPRPSVSRYRQLLQLLKNSPALRVFIFRWPNAWIVGAALQHVHDTVELPNLRQMCIGDCDALHIRSFLSKLILPRGLCLSIVNSWSGDDTPTYAPLPEDTSRFHFLHDITSLEILFTIHVSGEQHVRVSGIGPSGSLNVNILADMFEPPAEERVALEVYIHHSGILRNLTELWIHGPHSIVQDDRFGHYKELWDESGNAVLNGPEMWCRILAGMENLEKLVLESSIMVHHLCSLALLFDCEPGPVDEAHDLPVIPCPRLKHLWIAGATNVLFSISERLHYLTYSRHLFHKIPFHEILLRSTTHEASYCRLMCTDDGGGSAPMVKAGKTLRELEKHVDTFQFVDVFPTKIFELPALAMSSRSREGTVYWPRWRLEEDVNH